MTEDNKPMEENKNTQPEQEACKNRISEQEVCKNTAAEQEAPSAPEVGLPESARASKERLLGESLRVRKAAWLKEEIKRQREAEDTVLEQMLKEQEVIDRLNCDINQNMEKTRESRRFNREFQEKMNAQIYEMHGISEDKLKGIREYKNAYYQGCTFSLFLLSVVLIVICGLLHGFDSQICLFMIAASGVEAALLAQDKGRRKIFDVVCRVLYLLMFPLMMVIFVCFELGYPEYGLFLPYCAVGTVVILIIGTADYFCYDPYRQDKRKVKEAKSYIAEVEKIAQKEVRKNQRQQEREERRQQRRQKREERKERRRQRREERKEQFKQRREEKKEQWRQRREEKSQEKSGQGDEES